MDMKVENAWKPILDNEFAQPYFKELAAFVAQEYDTQTIYPPKDDVFNSFAHCDISRLKVVILGQDPYHEPNQAHGMCFSVQKGVDIPPSLKNIYQEIHDDLGYPIPTHGCLNAWADQGVLLLNTVLTVRRGAANSHKGHGWEVFTDHILQYLNTLDQPIVFLLWGKPAQTKAAFLNNPNHLVLKAPHPSPLSVYRGFSGCRHFSLTNRYLMACHLTPIDWRIL